jgi:hypothetical protein
MKDCCAGTYVFIYIYFRANLLEMQPETAHLTIHTHVIRRALQPQFFLHPPPSFLCLVYLLMQWQLFFTEKRHFC